MHEVITWDNNGLRSVMYEHKEADALRRAKTFRTLENRTVKIGLAGCSTHHWSRSLWLSRNHWSARVVDGEFLV